MTADAPAAPITAAEARRAARNAGAIAAASLLSRGLQFGWQLILAPGLGPAAYGIYGAVAAFIMVGSSIPNFGMGPIVIRDVARQPALAGKYLTATLFIQTLLALLAYVGLNAAAALGGYGEAVRAFIAIAGLSLIVDIWGNMCNDLLLAQERMTVTSVVTVAHVALLLALAGAGLAAGLGLVGVYGGTLIAGLLRTAALWALVLRGGTRPVWPLDRTLAWPLLRNGAPLFAAAFLTLLYQQADKLLTNRLIGDAATGYLAVAFLIIFGVIELLNGTVLTATFPLMSRVYDGGRSATFGFLVNKLALFTLLTALPIALVLSLFAAEITTPLFGDDFRPTADVLRVLIWYAPLAMFAAVVARGMTVMNQQRVTLLLRAVGLAVNVGLLLALLPLLGVTGAAVASVCAEALVLALLLRTFQAAGWARAPLLRRVLRLLALSVVAAGTMALLEAVHPLVGILSGLIVYTIGLRFAGILAADDWDFLYRLAAAMPGGALIRRVWRRDTPINW